MAKKGIDVSYCQRGLNWASVKSSGYEFALIRAGNDPDNRFDTEFDNHVKQAIKYDIPFGVYWYMLANTPKQARLEASWCLQKIEQCKDKIRLPIYYDMEVQSTLNSSAVSEIADAFRGVIAADGYWTGLYCSTGWITKIKQDVIDKFDSVWIAEWGNECTYKGSYDIWQNGRTPTFGGKAADEDIMIRDIIENRQYMRDLQPLREGVELIRKTSERLEKLLSEGK